MTTHSGQAPAIDVRGLTKQYGGKHVVHSVDLQIGRGEVFALLGPNGAGKTTTVEILCGVRTRTSGSVTVLGHDPANYARRFRDRVGVVPQNTGAFDDLRLTELVGHFGKAYSRPLPATEVIHLVGLSEKADALCRTMSGGQRRRVDVALALIGDPDLIFLDEPTTGLDPEVRHQFWDVVRMLAQRGKTILLTTHYLDEAEALADRVGVMIGGRLAAVGAPTDIGGRRDAQITVSFRRTMELAGMPLPPLPAGSTVSADGDTIAVGTAAPTALTRLLIDWAAAHGVSELPGLRVHRASLEDVYLRMISDYGRSGDAMEEMAS